MTGPRWRLPEDVPTDLHAGPVRLRCEGVRPGDAARGKVPYYHFQILESGGAVVGHLNFRVGDTRHVRQVAGHLGYAVLPEHRGHAYAYHACLAAAPFVRRIYQTVVLTVDPANEASQRTIRKLGARFLDEVEVPADDPAYETGARRKLRFEWAP